MYDLVHALRSVLARLVLLASTKFIIAFKNVNAAQDCVALHFYGEIPMKIKWYGTATLLIDSGSTRILIDPYLKPYNKKLPPVPLKEAASADAIFITHPHLDHFIHVGAFTGGNVKNIYVSKNGIERAQKHGIFHELMTPLGADEEITVGDITVRTFESRHCKFDAAAVLGIVFNPLTYIHPRRVASILKDLKQYKITDDIYALEVSCGGKSIMVLGSAGMEKGVSYPTGADLFVFPYQGRARMHKYILPFLQTFRPKAVMLDHFDNAFPPFTHNVSTKKFLPAVKENFPEIKAFVPVEDEWYEI